MLYHFCFKLYHIVKALNSWSDLLHNLMSMCTRPAGNLTLAMEPDFSLPTLRVSRKHIITLFQVQQTVLCRYP